MIKDHLGSRAVGGSGVMLQIHHIELIITTGERKSETAGLLLTNISFENDLDDFCCLWCSYTCLTL